MFIKELKLVNFMSFVGENKIKLKPYSAVLYASVKGKEDLIKAISFILGNERKYCRDELFHECLNQSESGGSHVLEVSASVETMRADDMLLILTRQFKSGEHIYFVNGVETPEQTYLDVCDGMGCAKQAIHISTHLFSNAIYEPEGIEQLFSNFMGVDLRREELLETLQQLKAEERAYAMHVERRAEVISRHEIALVDNVVDELEKARLRLDIRRDAILRDLRYDVEEFSESLPSDIPQETASSTDEDSQHDYNSLYIMEQNLEAELMKVRLQEAELQGSIDFTKMKLAAADMSQQTELLRSNEVDRQIGRLEAALAEIQQELDLHSRELVANLTVVHHLFRTKRQNRITSYGRLIDWLRIADSNYLHLLKHILGEPLLYAHLIDRKDMALHYQQLLRHRYVENRTHFLLLSEQSPKLKELLFEGEKTGITIDSYNTLQKFVSQLYQLNLIADMPILVLTGTLDPAAVEEGKHYVFVEAGEYMDAEGCFGRIDLESPSLDATHTSRALNNANSSIKHQEFLFNSMRRVSYEILRLQNQKQKSSEDELPVRALRRIQLNACPSSMPSPTLDSVYGMYRRLFEEERFAWEKAQREINVAFDVTLFTGLPKDASVLQNTLMDLKGKLKVAVRTKKDIDQQLSDVRDKLENITEDNLKMRFITCNPFIQPEVERDRESLALNSRIKILRNLVNKTDMQESLSCRDARNKILDQLKVEANEAAQSMKRYAQSLREIVEYRRATISGSQQIFNELGPSLMQMLIGRALTQVKFVMSNENVDPMRIVCGDGDTVTRILNVNVFLRCSALLTFLLCLAKVRRGMMLMIDDVSDFFPPATADISDAVGINTNAFSGLCRLSSGIKLFLNQICEDIGSSPRGTDLMMLGQVVIFTELSSVASASDAQVLIINEFEEDNLDNFATPYCRVINF